MSRELVPTAGLDPRLRSLFAYADLQNIHVAVANRATLDDYAESQMRTVITDILRERDSHPLMRRLDTLEESVGSEQRQAPAVHTLTSLVEQKIAAPAPAHPTDVSRLTKRLALSLHPDIQDGRDGQDPDLLKKITEAGAKSVASFSQMVALAAAETAKLDADPAETELKRYQAWLGLHSGKRSKYQTVEEVDRDVTTERRRAKIALPFVVADKSLNLTFQLLERDTYRGREAVIAGADAEQTARCIQNAAYYIRTANIDEHQSAGGDPHVQTLLEALVDSVDAACQQYAQVRPADRQYLEWNYRWNETVQRIGANLYLTVDRMRQLRDMIQPHSIVIGGLLRAMRSQQQHTDPH